MKIPYSGRFARCLFIICILLSTIVFAADPQELFLDGEYEKLIEIEQPEGDAAYFQLEALFSTGQYAQVIEKAAAGLDDLRIREISLKAYLVLQQIDQGHKLISQYPDYSSAAVMDILKASGEDREERKAAYRILKRFRNEDPENIQDVLAISRAWQTLDKFQKAMNAVQAYKTENKFEQIQILIETGDLFASKYNIPAALQEYGEALKIAPKNTEALSGAASAFFAQGNLDQAIRFGKMVLAINPQAHDMRVMAAYVPLMERALADARAELAPVLEAEPAHPGASALEAAALLLERKQDDFEKAVAAFEEQGPAMYEFNFMLANFLTSIKKGNTALPYLQKLLVQDPDDPIVLSAIGRILLRNARITEAKAMLERAHEIDNFNVEVYNTLELLDKVEDYTRIETEHFTLIYDERIDEVTARYFEDKVEEMYDQLTALYGFDLPERAYIFFFPRHDYLAVMTTGLPNLGMPALCVGNSVYCDTPNVASSHISMNWFKVIRHELVHVFNLLQTDFNIPHWFTEGLAVYSEQMEHRYQWDQIMLRAAVLGKLNSFETMNLGFYRPEDPLSRNLAYAEAHLAMLYLIKTRGTGCISKFLKAFKNGLSFAEAVPVALEISIEELQHNFDAYRNAYLENLGISPLFLPQDDEQLRELAGQGNLHAASWILRSIEDPQAADEFAIDGHVPGILRLGQAAGALQRNQPEEALKFLDMVITDKNFFYYQLKGYAYMALDKDWEAQPLLIEACKHYAWEPDSIYTIATVYRETDNLPAYREWMQKFVQVDDSNLERLTEFAVHLGEAGQQMNALNILDIALSANPSHTETRILRGAALLKSGKVQAALKDYYAAATIRPYDLEINTDLIKILKALNKKEQAKQIKERLIQKHGVDKVKSLLEEVF